MRWVIILTHRADRLFGPGRRRAETLATAAETAARGRPGGLPLDGQSVAWPSTSSGGLAAFSRELNQTSSGEVLWKPKL